MWATMPSLGELCQSLKVLLPLWQTLWSSSTAQHCCSGNKHLLYCQDCFGWGLWGRCSPEASSLANTIFTSVLVYALNFLLLLVFYINWFYGPRCLLVSRMEQMHRQSSVLICHAMPTHYIPYGLRRACTNPIVSTQSVPNYAVFPVLYIFVCCFKYPSKHKENCLKRYWKSTKSARW